jgi:thiol-disulfide isomerase/thioredoxin
MKSSQLKKVITLLLLSTVAIFTLVGCKKSDGANTSTTFKDMETTDINGNKVDSSIFSENKLTLVNVWNTGCSPCVDEIPILDKLNKEYEGKGVTIKGLLLESGVGLTDDEKTVVEEILQKSNSTYQQLTISKEMLESEIFKNLAAFPSTFFIDKDGNIVERIDGSSDYKGWKTRIEDTLKKVDVNE